MIFVIFDIFAILPYIWLGTGILREYRRWLVSRAVRVHTEPCAYTPPPPGSMVPRANGTP